MFPGRFQAFLISETFWVRDTASRRHMYGKFGSVWNATMVLDQMIERNVVSWKPLVSALGLNGYEQEIVERFKHMEMICIKPEKIDFISVISACRRHAALVKEGMELFKK
uniref:Pentatricopeptide repeat-containing protein At3g58590 n=1 Tax=Tanacetum cinerariifolium TaxID=118510 RepID=A0A6L2N821_TANCI|nr:pentatricopeptide repeat-containing protein At3g58590 [Tanacetum cinerariifolium]